MQTEILQELKSKIILLNHKEKKDLIKFLEKETLVSNNLNEEEELKVLFRFVLTGYGSPLSVIHFIWSIFLMTNPGIEYEISDTEIAKFSKISSKTYISKCRKKYKEWISKKHNDGLSHNKFIFIHENKYNTSLKKQIPTRYVFSSDLAVLLEELFVKVQQHSLYKTNFIKAIKQICKQEIQSLNKIGLFKMPKRFSIGKTI